MRDGEDVTRWGYMTQTKKWSEGNYSEHGTFLDKVARGDEVGRLDRILTIRSHFKTWAKRYRPHYVALEDYVWGQHGKGGGVIQIAELGGQLRLTAKKLLARCRTYDPMTVKLFWAGSAVSSKEDMMRVSAEWLQEAGNGVKNRDLLLSLYQGSAAGQKLFEGVSDALAISELLRLEVAVRQGDLSVKDLTDQQYRALTRETKGRGSVLDSEFF